MDMTFVFFYFHPYFAVVQELSQHQTVTETAATNLSKWQQDREGFGTGLSTSVAQIQVRVWGCIPLC